MKENVDERVDEIINTVLDDGNVEVVATGGAPVSPETWLAVKAKILALLAESKETR